MLLTLFLLSFANAGQVVVIGDSLSCGPFGEQLVRDLSASGDRVRLYCAVSSAPEHWLEGRNPGTNRCMTRASGSGLRPCAGDGRMPRLDSLLRTHRGARVIVALGTNSLGSPKPGSAYKRFSSLVGQSGAACDWIGPPHLNPSQARGFSTDRLAGMESNLRTFYPGLRQSVGGSCRVIDSRGPTARNTVGSATVDGVHRTKTAGVSWAKKLAPQLVTEEEWISIPITSASRAESAR